MTESTLTPSALADLAAGGVDPLPSPFSPPPLEGLLRFALELSGGAEPAAPVSPTPRGLIVQVAGKPGDWRVRSVEADVVEVVGVNGQGFATVALADIRRA